MRLSTTVNFFIYEDEGNYLSYYKDLEHYAELGFSCLDCIFCSADAAFSPLRLPNYEEWAYKIREKADQLGIRFVQTHVPFYNFCDPQKGIDPDKEEIIRRSIVCTKILGAFWTVAHPGTSCGDSLIGEGSRRKNLEYFSGHLEFAKRHNVGICIENMADFPGQGYPRSYCATVEELADLVDTLSQSWDNVGICWDFGHANLMYGDQIPCLEYLGSRIKVTHVHDNMGKTDEHRAPFLGNIKWDEIMKALVRCGYEGDFSFEVKRLAANVPENIKDSYWEYMKKTGGYLLSLTE